MTHRHASRIASLILPLGLVACAIDTDVDDDLDEPDPDGVTAAEVCVQPVGITPALDEPLWSLSNHQNRTTNGSGYGTGACDEYTIGIRNIEYVEITATDLPSNETDCERYTLTVRKFRKGVDGYEYVGSRFRHGVFDGSTCSLSTIYDEHNASDLFRYASSASRTVCSGMYCGTTSGRPLNITARGYDP